MTDQIYPDGVFDGFLFLILIAMFVAIYWLIFELPGIIRRRLGRREKAKKCKKPEKDKPERLMRSDYCKACQTVCSLEIENQQLRHEIEMIEAEKEQYKEEWRAAEQRCAILMDTNSKLRIGKEKENVK